MKSSDPPAPALARGVRLIEQLARDGQAPLELLAGRNGWPKSSVLRCLQTLEDLGVVERDADTRHWIARRRLAPVLPEASSRLDAARHRLPALAEAAGHCAELYRASPEGLELVDRADPVDSEIRVHARVGFRRDLRELDATSAVYFAFTGAKPPRAMWAWKHGRKRKVSAPERDRRLQQVRETGLAADSEFNENGVRRFCRPLSDPALLVAVAQRQTPLADRQTDTILETLKLFNP